MATENRNITYLNKDFSQFKASLIDYARTYFPTSYNDFSPSSPGMMFLEMASYVGDVMSFYLDNQIQLGRFDAVFFDDFPLPAKEAGPTYSRTAACESEAVSGDLGDGMDDAIRFSRWVTLLSELKRGGHLCDGARITGYLARPLSAAELSGIAELGAFEVGWRTYAVTVPQNCPYFDGTELLVPCFVFREALGLDPQPQAYAAHEPEVEVEGMLMYMPGSREENPVDSERATRQQLRLPPPKNATALR